MLLAKAGVQCVFNRLVTPKRCGQVIVKKIKAGLDKLKYIQLRIVFNHRG